MSDYYDKNEEHIKEPVELYDPLNAKKKLTIVIDLDRAKDQSVVIWVIDRALVAIEDGTLSTEGNCELSLYDENDDICGELRIDGFKNDQSVSAMDIEESRRCHK